MSRMLAAALGLVVLLAASLSVAAEAPIKAWSEKWRTEEISYRENPLNRCLHAIID